MIDFRDHTASSSMSKRSRRTKLRTRRQTPSDQPTSDLPVLRASSIPDLLGSVPALLGFHPQRSLVVLTMKGKRIGLRMRVDLPAPAYADACAHNLMPPLVDQEPDGVLLVAYVDREPGGEIRGANRLEADALVDAMQRRLSEADVEVREAVCCDGSRYWSYLCDNEECCPSAGSSYEVESTSTMANAVFNGVEVLPDRESLERRFEPVEGARHDDMEAATQQVVEEIAKAHGIFLGGERVADRYHQGKTALLQAGEAYVEPLLADLDPSLAETLDDDMAARLMVWTRLLAVRDLAWSFITDTNARDHLALWTAVAQRAVSPFEPAPLCLASFCAWLAGDGAQAACAASRATEVAPDYTLAHLITDLLERCVPPTAWQQFEEAMIQAPFAPRTT